MPQPSRRPSWHQFVRGGQAALAGLDSPKYRAEALREDLDPGTMRRLGEALGDPRHQNPVAQQALMDEKQRLEQQQAQFVAQTAQQFPQRLAEKLDLQQHTQMGPNPAAFMAKLMLQMQRRYPGMQGGAGGPVATGDY